MTVSLRLAASLVTSVPVILAVVIPVAPADAATKAKNATVIAWADGDSLTTSRGPVRLVGIDTPEVGSCGASDAKTLSEQLAPPGSTIKLIRPAGVQNRDRYGRLLRYVKRSGVDIGIRQVRNGAAARYDGLDGYQRHAKQTKYRRADGRVPNYCGEASPVPLAGGGGSYPPTSLSTCPSHAPIKGNQGSPEWIYHVPGGGSYNVTNPEECFATETDAVNAGYRRALN